MRNGKPWVRAAWLTIGLLAALAVSVVASDETFCVMQHTGYFNLTGGSLTFWYGSGADTNDDPEFALITVTVAQLKADSTGTCACLTGGVYTTLGVGGVATNIKIEWNDMSGKTRSYTITLWNDSCTFYARWAKVTGTGRGFYTITFNPCGSE